MRYLAPIAVLIAMVVLMAGSGTQGLKAARSIILVIAGVVLMAVFFGLVLKRTL